MTVMEWVLVFLNNEGGLWIAEGFENVEATRRNDSHAWIRNDSHEESISDEEIRTVFKDGEIA
jgi:hypothetical protein